MNNNLTEIVCVIDESGSMNSIYESTISGFNEFITSQELDGMETRVTTVTFNQNVKSLFEGVKPHKAILNHSNYRPNGCTALLDAVGSTIDKLGRRLSAMKEENRPHQVIFVIVTDGYENASRKYNYNDVHERITRQKNTYSWQFVFIGANIDVISEAANLGIDANDSYSFEAKPAENQKMYRKLANYIHEMRK